MDLPGPQVVESKRLNEHVKRNCERFPADFLFQLDAADKAKTAGKKK